MNQGFARVYELFRQAYGIVDETNASQDAKLSAAMRLVPLLKLAKDAAARDELAKENLAVAKEAWKEEGDAA